MQPFKSPSLLEEQEIDEHFRPILVRPMEHQAAALRRFRRTNRIGIAAIILFLPAGIIAALVTRGTSMTPWIPLLVCAACGITFLIAAFRIRAFRCPRCGKRFTVAYPQAPNSTGRRCVHCGLESCA
jgi:predicted RNA-binding Zn-ribbon protein involved in translation (DUF1610 family)